MFIGIDLGTSSCKSVLVDGADRILASAGAPLTVSRPHPGWSEQHPADWWQAALDSLDELARKHPKEMSAVTGIGLSGQMHGATLLDGAGATLRPAMLWNDVRSSEECAEIERVCPQSRAITGNPAMPGFTAPKVLWVKRHEPDVFARIATVLLPKAWLRWQLSGEMVEEMSDASGTLWLDVGKRDWSDAMLTATGLERRQMPRLVEGNAVSARLKADLAQRWGMAKPPVIAGGGGDNAAGAVGLGAISPGDAFVSLGTSGVLWATTAGFAPNADQAVHAFCHAVPNTWHQMGVILSAAACLSWLAQVTGASEAELLTEAEAAPDRPSTVLFLPYLSGERTPHNDAAIRGHFVYLSHDTTRADLTRAVLEGVAFAIADCRAALAKAGTRIAELSAIGGGARSRLWLQILADVLDCPIARLADAEAGAAQGAARLGRMAATGESPEQVCRKPEILERILPRDAARYTEPYRRFRHLYPALKGEPS